ncbi:uncharacterized protein LOC108914016 [Anoplophora glabripennis]|uniref:uncharacterized protein LOC108914016 n=1 Tax=Anoplophora glabripennis TaxID=217634 RepID=UPI0008740F14|nr:uncharacterized protein LOC108914016 [Anoplophora glabripennis]
MCRIYYLILITITHNFIYVNSSSSNTVNGIPETFSNLTSGNELWSSLVKDCMPPTFSCIKNKIYEYMKHTLDYQNDIQFTSFLKFPKNSVNYIKPTLFEEIVNETNDSSTTLDDSTPIEEMSRSLTENTIKFFMTHDLELQLPENFFMGTTVKISPKSFEENGAMVKFEIVPKSIKDSVGEGRLFFKRIRKFISQRLIYALLAILLVIKLLAVKVLFVLPTIVGVAAAKKLLLKVLLFLFPALHHLFKLCAYVPYGAKHHIHKHQISHIHEISQHPHYHGSNHKRKGYVEADSSQETSPLHHFSDPHRDYHKPHEIVGHVHPKIPYFEKDSRNSVNRNDLDLVHNEIGVWNQNQGTRPIKQAESRRPLTPTEIKNMVLMAEREAEIKQHLQMQKQKIHEENIRLQEQLSNALKIQQKLKQQAAMMFNSKISQNAILPTINNSTAQFSQFLQSPPDTFATSISTGTILPRLDAASSQKGLQLSAQNHLQQQQKPLQNKKHEPYYDNSKLYGNDSPFLKGVDISKAATITYDPFYSPILEKIDKILEVFGFNEESCKERLICSMYKNPPKYSPHSNLLSTELSRETKDLQKPTSTNAAVIRFYKYVQAARDGQDQRDCMKLYLACKTNMEI